MLKRSFLPLLILLVSLAVLPRPGAASPHPRTRCLVYRVIDGDTIRVELGARREKIRFIGVDAREIGEDDKPDKPYAREACAFVQNKLAGRVIWLEYDIEPRDKYGRLLAYVRTTLPEKDPPREADLRARMFNAALLLGGYARVMPIAPNLRYAGRFRAFQNEARAARKGIWR